MDIDLKDIAPGAERKPVGEDTYLDEKDGLVHCRKCGMPRQKKVDFLGEIKIVYCLCKCEGERMAAEKKRRDYEEKMHQIHRVKDASMMDRLFRDAVFERYIVTDDNREVHKLAMNYVRDFKSMYQKNQGIIFYGPCGTGKSFTAACIANSLMEQLRPVIMTSFVKILQNMNNPGFDETGYINTLNSASLLIVDDLGTERTTDFAMEKVYNIIDSRVRAMKPMILTTNTPLEDMLNATDIRYRRIYDRIFECCYPVNVSGSSFRRAEAARRFEEMKSLMEG